MTRQLFASRPCAFTLLEVCFASAIAALVLSGLFAVNSRIFSILRNGKETLYATQILQARAETLRSLNWTSVSSKTTLQNLFSRDAMRALSAASTSPDPVAGTSTANLNISSERLIATAYYPPPATAPVGGAPAGIELIRNRDGTFAALPSGDPNTGTTLAVAPAMKVQLTVWWVGAGGRTRQREVTTIVAHFGL